jgi:hypothetical protein
MNVSAVASCRRQIWIAARLLPILAARRSLGSLLKLATPSRPVALYEGMEAEQIVAIVKRAARRPWLMRDRRCLREGLLAFRFLSLAGYRPELHFSVAPSSLSESRPRAHCWLTLDGRTILNPCSEPMIELFSYDGTAFAGDVERPVISDVAHA